MAINVEFFQFKTTPEMYDKYFLADPSSSNTRVMFDVGPKAKDNNRYIKYILSANMLNPYIDALSTVTTQGVNDIMREIVGRQTNSRAGETRFNVGALYQSNKGSVMTVAQARRSIDAYVNQNYGRTDITIQRDIAADAAVNSITTPNEGEAESAFMAHEVQHQPYELVKFLFFLFFISIGVISDGRPQTIFRTRRVFSNVPEIIKGLLASRIDAVDIYIDQLIGEIDGIGAKFSKSTFQEAAMAFSNVIQNFIIAIRGIDASEIKIDSGINMILNFMRNTVHNDNLKYDKGVVPHYSSNLFIEIANIYSDGTNHMDIDDATLRHYTNIISEYCGDDTIGNVADQYLNMGFLDALNSYLIKYYIKSDTITAALKHNTKRVFDPTNADRLIGVTVLKSESETFASVVKTLRLGEDHLVVNTNVAGITIPNASEIESHLERFCELLLVAFNCAPLDERDNLLATYRTMYPELQFRAMSGSWNLTGAETELVTRQVLLIGDGSIEEFNRELVNMSLQNGITQLTNEQDFNVYHTVKFEDIKLLNSKVQFVNDDINLETMQKGIATIYVDPVLNVLLKLYADDYKCVKREHKPLYSAINEGNYINPLAQQVWGSSNNEVNIIQNNTLIGNNFANTILTYNNRRTAAGTIAYYGLNLTDDFVVSSQRQITHLDRNRNGLFIASNLPVISERQGIFSFPALHDGLTNQVLLKYYLSTLNMYSDTEVSARFGLNDTDFRMFLTIFESSFTSQLLSSLIRCFGIAKINLSRHGVSIADTNMLKLVLLNVLANLDKMNLIVLGTSYPTNMIRDYIRRLTTDQLAAISERLIDGI